MNNKGFHHDPTSTVAVIFVAIDKSCDVQQILKNDINMQI
jgi:hypothetical protein